MTNEEALQLFEDLNAIKALRANKFWLNHFLPELIRMRTEARTGMRDRTQSPEIRCERVAEHEQVQVLLDYLDKEEARLRTLLNEHDKTTPIIERGFK